MDNTLIKMIENNKIKQDDTFRFRCTQCGQCCINREDILLNAKDVFYIARKLEITPERLIEKYGEVYIGSSSRIPIVRLKPVGKDKRCPFLDSAGQKCSIHEEKPVVCAMFPIGRAAILDNERSEKKASVEYFFTDPGCGDNSESHTLRDWLAGFGIPVEDEIFIAWQQTIMALCSASIALEKLMRNAESMYLFWKPVMFFLFLNYDTKKDFLAQFRENMNELRKLAGIASDLSKGSDSKEGKSPAP